MTNAGDALAPGTQLHELEIERVLGSGGFGITYLAQDLSLDTWRAVKEYLPREWGTRRQDGTVGPWTGGNTEDYQWGLERFLDEARILARFKHPHIVQVHRVFEALGTAYMVMEYVEGRTLASQVEAAGALSEDRVREVLDGLTKGLKEVHAAGLLHRDIKPGNVVVRQDGSPVLIDFGAARQAMGGHSGSLASVLTPGYAPIEQYPPGNRQGPWTDIYALGALTYCALSGVVPKAATERTREDRLRPLVEVAPQGVSPGLARAVGKAMAVYQEDRPQDLEAWQRLLDALPDPVVEKPLGPGGSSRGETSAPPRQWWLAGAAVVGVVGVVLAMTLSSRNGAGPDEGGGRVETAPVAAEADRIGDGDGGGVVRETESDEEAAVVERLPAREALSPAAAEEALGLDRNARRLIQAALLAAGLDVGPLDGEFGPGTRAVLREWQVARGVEATGYLTRESVAALRAIAASACEGWNTDEYFRSATEDNVTACIAIGADLEARADGGWTPLHIAASFSGSSPVLHALIAAGADLDARQDAGWTPLHAAAGFGDSPEVLRALVGAGANLDARDDDGGTPLHQTAGFGDSPAVLRALVGAGANLEARDGNGLTPLHHAAFLGDSPAVLRALVGAGANLEARDGNGLTPLLRAAAGTETVAILEALIAVGADTEAVTNGGENALRLAALINEENPAVLRGLIDFGDDSGDYTNDGDCDDIRFGGDRGDAAWSSDTFVLRDATDCRLLMDDGRILFLGDDSGNYANDGDCDDVRFGGDRGSGALDDNSHVLRDATDCRLLLNDERIFLR